MRLTRKATLWIASLAAALICGVAYGAMPMLTGEDVNMSLTVLLRNLSNAAKGSMLIYENRDDLRPLAPPAVDNYSLFWDSTTELPFWGPTADTFTGTLLTTSGGTGLASWTQGDIPYFTSGTALSKLAKSAIQGDILGNTGASNVPAWVPAERPVFTNITQGTLAGDTVAATALTTTGEGSVTLPVTQMNRIGQVFHIIAAGGLTCDADGGEADVIDVRIGGAGGKSIAASTAIALGADTDAPWRFDLWLTILTTGATATGYCTGIYEHTVAAGSVHKDIHTHITVGDALNLTATKDIVVVNDFAGTDAQDSVSIDMLYCTGNNQDTD